MEPNTDTLRLRFMHAMITNPELVDALELEGFKDDALAKARGETGQIGPPSWEKFCRNLDTAIRTTHFNESPEHEANAPQA